MKTILIVLFCGFYSVNAQLSFSGNSNKPTTTTTTPKPSSDDPNVDLRLGLLANTHLGGKNPTGGNSNPDKPTFQELLDNDGGDEASGRQGQRLCCCTSRSICPIVQEDDDDYFNDYDDLVGSGIINPRTQQQRQNNSQNDFIGTRIANNPNQNGGGLNNPTCPSNRNLCCYNNVLSLDSVQNVCTPASNIGNNPVNEFWRESCTSNVPNRRDTCGLRSSRFQIASNRQQGEASPEEFPWTCLILNQRNDFVGTCVIIPPGFNNDISRGTRYVLTAAHKLSNVTRNELLKVRVLEYDASGSNFPERRNHSEYTVTRFVTHNQFNPRRLDNNIALLEVNRNIALGRETGVNAACLPSCSGMFSQVFSNGTGTRCWTAGWGRDSETGNFQFVQKKVDLPLVPDNTCENSLKQAIGRRRPAAGRRFTLSGSEICAGAENGKDACSGDGGAPLVCQTRSGHWHVVGLVTWGVGCAQPNVPGVYARISYFRNWIQQNMN